MSTKTTFKRVALVTVAALGFGLLGSIAPANAAVTTFTASAALSHTNMTVVSSVSGDTKGGKFYVDVTGNGALADDLDAVAYQGLMSGESITVQATSAPTTYASGTTGQADVGDVTIQPLKLTTNTCSVGTEYRAATTAFTVVGSAAASVQIPNTTGTVGTTDSYASNNCSPDASGGNDVDGRFNRYWFSIIPGAEALDAGAFTIRVRVVNADSLGATFIDKTLTVNFVTFDGP